MCKPSIKLQYENIFLETLYTYNDAKQIEVNSVGHIAQVHY